MILENLDTEILGRSIIYFDSIESTQTYAKSLKTEEAINGTVVLTNSQTNGIGTRDRRWYTGKGKNIAMTFILYPNCNINRLSRLTITIAECIVKAIKELYGYELEIKEPNDIVYRNKKSSDSKKIGGILTESIVEEGIAKRLYIGIGLNVNQEKFPGTLSEIASSLKIEFGKEFSREDIISKFFNIFEKEYNSILKSIVKI